MKYLAQRSPALQTILADIIDLLPLQVGMRAAEVYRLHLNGMTAAAIAKQEQLPRLRVEQMIEQAETRLLIRFAKDYLEAFMLMAPLPENGEALLVALAKIEAEKAQKAEREAQRLAEERAAEEARAAERPLKELGLSARSYNVLRQMRVHTIEGAARLSAADLLRARGCGTTTLAEIARRLEERGLRLQP